MIPWLERIGGLWRNLALVSFNGVVLGLAFLFLLDGALELRHRATGVGQAHHSGDFDRQSYTELDQESVRAVGLEHDRMGNAQAFAYAPWNTFKTGAFSGAHINVVDETVISRRLTPSPDPAHQGQPPLRVWAFGGSTMFGWGMPDSLALPAMLQQELQKLAPERQVEVLNFGQPYWFSSSELSAFAAMLRERPAPHVAVFLDGLNDSVLGAMGRSTPFFAARAEQAWERARADEANKLPWFSVNNSLPLIRVAQWLRYQGVLPKQAPKDPYIDPQPAPEALAERMWLNWNMIRQLGESRGVAVMHALQPLPWIGGYSQKAVPSGVFQPDYVVRLYQNLEERIKAVPGHAVSMAMSLEGIERPYVDSTHYSDAANRQLARLLAKHVIEAMTLSARITQ